MILSKNSKIIEVSKYKTLEESKEEICLPVKMRKYINFDTGVRFIDDDPYFSKWVDEDSLVNELIGSFLSKELELEAVDYKMGILDNNDFVALSKVFYEPGYEYFHPLDYDSLNYCGTNMYNLDYIKFNWNIDGMKKLYLDETVGQFDENIRKKLLKLIALDLKMSQADRHKSENIMFKKNVINGTLDLAPIYDFGFSYIYGNPNYFTKSKFIYVNPFICLRKSKESLNVLADKYPEFKDYVETMSCIYLDDVLDKLEQENGFTLSSTQRLFYQQIDEKNNKILTL